MVLKVLMQAKVSTPPSTPGAACTAEAALKAFFQVTGRWGLTSQEQMLLLGQPPRSTFFAWKEGSRALLAQDTVVRINYVLGIWKALRQVQPDVPLAVAWLREPNSSPLFEGASPLAVLVRGRIPDLADVRRLLDARMGLD